LLPRLIDRPKSPVSTPAFERAFVRFTEALAANLSFESNTPTSFNDQVPSSFCFTEPPTFFNLIVQIPSSSEALMINLASSVFHAFPAGSFPSANVNV